MTAYEQVTVNLTERSARALELAAEIEDLSKTDTVNRALQLHAYILQELRRGSAVIIRQPDGTEKRAGVPMSRERCLPSGVSDELLREQYVPTEEEIAWARSNVSSDTSGWLDDEELDFTVHGAPAEDGTIWCVLRCSVHGSVSAMVTWDVGELLIACDRHYRNVHRGTETKSECSGC